MLLIQRDITMMAWIKPHEVLNNWQVILSMQRGSSNGEAYALTYGRNNDHLLALFNTQGGNGRVEDPDPIAMDEWVHAASTYDGEKAVIFRNAQPVAEISTGIRGALIHEDRMGRFAINGNYNSLDGGLSEHCSATIDEVLVFDEVLAQEDIQNFMEFGYESAGVPRTTAYRPSPADGAMLQATWAHLSWHPGTTAVSHDVYIGDNFENVDAGTESTFQGNQTGDFMVVGFPGFPIPDGLVSGTTYYWRVEDVEADGTVNKGDVWSFLITPETAYFPDPADGAEFVNPNATLSWTSGNGAKLHTFYIGDNYDDVSNAVGGIPLGVPSYDPDTLEREKVLYWRVDEFDGVETHKGDIWAFTTPGAVGNPQPANGAADVPMTATLSWTAADNATSHELYFGADADAVKNATTVSPEYVGPKAIGAVSYDPGGLEWESGYAWRVDEVYPTGAVKGVVWSFTTADFLLVDDFESYDDIDPAAGEPGVNRIFDKWIDGFGTTTNGAVVGNALPPYVETSIVHGGGQSMNYSYDNNLKTSEATLTLVYPRDWTEGGITKLIIWFRGAGANSAERMFVALNGNAVVYHDDPSVTQKTGWNAWVIDLQAFADQGVNLANVNTIIIGFGTKGSPAAGGTGMVYFDDIRLYR